MKTESTVEQVVAAGLCTQCGWCAMVCPAQAIALHETPAGQQFPRICAEACTSCGFCFSVCSGWNNVLRGMDGEADPFRGAVLAAFCGHAADPATRAGSQSGGLVSALIEHQLASGAIQGAVLASMPADGSLRPVAVLARDRDAVLRAGGSKYCPIRFEPSLATEVLEARQIAAVGISCQVQTLRNMEQQLPPWRKRLGLVIGLFCDRTMSTLAIDMLCRTAGCPAPEAVSFAWRSKERHGWPGEVRVEDRQGRGHFLPSRERIRLKDVLTPARCRVCFDKMNVWADISVGDPHGINSDREGHSVVLARNARGLEALRRAEADGAVRLEPLEQEKIFTAQKVEQRRMSCALYTAAWEKMGRRRPALPFAGSMPPAPAGRAVRGTEWELRQTARLAEAETTEAALGEAQRQLLAEQAAGGTVLKRARRLAGKYRRRLIGGR